MANSMAVIDHKSDMRAEVGRGAFATVEPLRHPTDGIDMIMKTVSKDKYEQYRKQPEVSLTHANEICILRTLDHTRILKCAGFRRTKSTCT